MGLILLRHTRPAIAPGICYGCSDIPLASSFEDELAALLPGLPAIDRIVSSPLPRCRILAERIGAELGLTPETDLRLAEMDFGRWEMQRWDEIPRGELDAWAADFHHARPHGGESVAMLLHRVSAFLDAWQSTPQTALAVTHAGIIRAALAARGAPGAWEARPGYGEPLRLPGRSDLDQ